MASQYDLTIIGGGILGLATALKITAAHPRLRLLLLEKEAGARAPSNRQQQRRDPFGTLLPAGVAKSAHLRRRTQRADRISATRTSCPMKFAARSSSPSAEEELPRLDELHRRGEANGLRGLETSEPSGLKELEPHATGIKGLYVPETGIIDYKKVAAAYAG